MSFYYASEKNKRAVNEDSFCQMDIRMNHEAVISTMAIADGMGGLSEGRRYSSTAINLWYEELVHFVMGEGFRDCALNDQINALQQFSARIYETLNQKLYRMGLDRGVKGGTTLTTAIHFWDRWIISNCGDSPAYIAKNGQIAVKSLIQNRAGEMVRDGKTTRGTAEFYQNKNKLSEYLGRKTPVHPFVTIVEDTEVDYVLIGSDGAFGNYDETSLHFMFQKENKEMLKELFNKVRDVGEEDNQTAILYVREDDILESHYIDTGVNDEDPYACQYKELEDRQPNETGIWNKLWRRHR